MRSTHAAHSLTGRSASDDTAAGVWCSGNNIILVPGIDTEPEAVNCILYYTDLKVCGGGTAFVPCLLRAVYAACTHTVSTVYILYGYGAGTLLACMTLLTSATSISCNNTHVIRCRADLASQESCMRRSDSQLALLAPHFSIARTPGTEALAWWPAQCDALTT